MAQSFLDADADGVPDDIEAALGLSPLSADSNGNGVPDGDEDFDRDGAPNAAERIAGFDPSNPRSKVPDELDGRVDTDLDGLPDWREAVFGTALDVQDTDGDLWADGVEVEVGTHPLDALSFPQLFSTGTFPTLLRPAESSPEWGGGRVPVLTAAPVILNPTGSTGDGPSSPLATPSVAPLVLLPGSAGNGTFSGVPGATPPVEVRIPNP
jgi:hypothetical protein